MMDLMWILPLFFTITICAYHKISLFITVFLLSIILVVATYFHLISIIPWIIFLLIAFPLSFTSLRQQIISRPVLHWFRNVMPEISKTEKEALNAGTTWWEKDLYSGNPNWKKLHQYPIPHLSAEEKAFIDGPVEDVCKMIDQHQISHQLTDLPQDVWQYLKDHKFFALIIKKEFSGLEFSAYAQSKILQKLAGISGELATTVGVPNSLGPSELLQLYGTKEQQNYYLPRLAKGIDLPCFALTHPEAGSDAGSIPDEGIICKGIWNDQEILGIKLTFNKRYITLAPVATLIGLAFKLRDPDQLLGKNENVGITCALIPADTKGIKIGRRHFPLNCMFQNGPILGNNVFVPLSFIIGGKNMAGKGWKMLMECLSVGRGITLPSNATGGVKTIAMATSAYARIRRQFNQPIGKFEGIEGPLASICANAYLMNAVCHLTTLAIDLGEKPTVISAIVKYHLTQKLQQSLINAMDIHGGKGICLGKNNYLGRAYQAAPIAITVEGANILTRSLIIYGQGAIRCHPYLLSEMDAAFNLDEYQGLYNFDKALFSHIGFFSSNLIRTIWMGITNGKLSNSPFTDETQKYYQLINRLSANLALLSDITLIILGGSVKKRERISARLGDILSALYLASACLKYYQDEERNINDLPLLQWAIEHTLWDAQSALIKLLDNYPAKIGYLLRMIIFPFGQSVSSPSDKLEHTISTNMINISEMRTRLGIGQFLTPTANNPVGIQEHTFINIIACEKLHKKVNQASDKNLSFTQLDKIADEGIALGILNDDEANLLRNTEKLRLLSINVDDFDPNALKNDNQISIQK